jgi:hypothetical protein
MQGILPEWKEEWTEWTTRTILTNSLCLVLLSTEATYTTCVTLIHKYNIRASNPLLVFKDRMAENIGLVSNNIISERDTCWRE